MKRMGGGNRTLARTVGLSLLYIGTVTFGNSCHTTNTDGASATAENSSSEGWQCEEGFTTFQGFSFELCIPASMTVERSQGPDFERFSFKSPTDSTKQFLFASDASFPPFPYFAPSDAAIESIKIGKLKALSIRWEDPGAPGLRSREVLITLWESEDHPPSMLHFGYTNLPETEMVLADKIISSVRYVEGSVESMYEQHAP